MDRQSIKQFRHCLFHELAAPVSAVAIGILQSQLFRPVLHEASVSSIYMYRHHGISGDIDELNGLRLVIQYRQDHAVRLTCLTRCFLLCNAVTAVDSQAKNVHKIIFILVSLAVVTDLTFLQFIGFFRFLCCGGFRIFLICSFLHCLCGIGTVALCMLKQARTAGGSPHVDEDHCDHREDCKQCQQYSQRAQYLRADTLSVPDDMLSVVLSGFSSGQLGFVPVIFKRNIYEAVSAIFLLHSLSPMHKILC